MRRFTAKSLVLVPLAMFLSLGQPSEASDRGLILSKWIDQRFEQILGESHGQSPLNVDDATFLRRVYLDLVGRIPSVAQIRDFVADSDDQKRLHVVEQLLSSERYSVHMARVWRRILLSTTTTSAPGFDTWLARQIANDTPYDELARLLVTAGGAAQTAVDASTSADSRNLDISAAEPAAPTTFLQIAGGQPANMASSVTRVFLGVRLECAQCHDHPFTSWRQEDFWGIAAFFSGARLASRPSSSPDSGESMPAVVDDRKTLISDQDGNSYSIGLPWSTNDKIEIPESQLPRQYFAAWMTSAENPQFAATAVNRIWQHFCGKGLTDSVDDLDQATAEQRDIILDDLADKFAESGFDTRALIKAICVSEFYQLSSERDQGSTTEASRPLKVLSPEQLFDSLEVALSMPISRIDQGPRYNGLRDAMVARMEETLGDRPDDFRSGIPQALSLMNGVITSDATDLQKSRTLRAVVDAPFLNDYEKLDALFLTTLSRRPHEAEKARFTDYIKRQESGLEKGKAFSEIMWALINSPEFILIR